MITFTKHLAFFWGVIFISNLNAQDYKAKFQKLTAQKDTLGQKKLLEEWEQKTPEDAELYVAYYNYFVLKSRKELIGIQPESNGENSFRLQDSTGKSVAFLNSIINYDEDVIKKGFDYIDKGISLFPDRLDMRFGKIYILGEINDYESFTKEIINTIEQSGKNNNKWLWTDSKPQSDAKQFMLSSIQNYVIQLYESNSDKSLDNMKAIAETVLKLYPDHVESITNLSIVYLIKKDFDKALEQLLNAEKIAPKDIIVLSNIAAAYNDKGDKKNSIKYYELIIKYGNDKAKDFAKKQIKGLKKK